MLFSSVRRFKELLILLRSYRLALYMNAKEAIILIPA